MTNGDATSNTYPTKTGESKEIKTIAYGKIKIVTVDSDKSGTFEDWRWRNKVE